MATNKRSRHRKMKAITFGSAVHGGNDLRIVDVVLRAIRTIASVGSASWTPIPLPDGCQPDLERLQLPQDLQND